MPRVVTCPHGHRWEIADGDLPPDGELVCPLCVSGREDPPLPSEVAAPEGERETPPKVAVVQGKTSPEAEAASQPERETAPAAGLPSVPGYEIREVLGRGGMGVVYRAWQVRLKREVALKMILAGPHAGAEQLDRFRIEAEAAARLHHPNVVQIHEIGEHEGRPFLALEYVNGGSLADQLKQSLLPAAVAAELVETLARAMHAAHRQGIIHRDLKPANILLAVSSQQSAISPTEGDRADRLTAARCSLTAIPKIADFGLAKQLGAVAGQTQSGAIMGTPSYMAPEQAEGKVKEIGPATDVYALGVILYEALTGRPPFQESSVLETLEQVRSQVPLAPRSLQPKVPRDLETICLKCLRKEAHQRYATALALADDLRRFREGRPIQARPVGKVERLGKWARRNPVPAVLTAGLLVMVLGLAVTNLRLRAALDERDQEAARANENLKEVLGFVDQLNDAGFNRLAAIPELKELRRKLLKRAVRICEALLAQKDNPSTQSQELVATAHRYLGIIHHGDHEWEQALDHYRQALEVWKTLADQFPDKPEYRSGLAHTCNVLGLLLKELNRPDEAQKYLLQGLVLREEVARQDGNNFHKQDDLANSYHNLGSFYLVTARPAEAKKALLQAAAIREQLVRDHCDNTALQCELAEDYVNLVHCFGVLQHYDEAVAISQKGVTMLEPLTRTAGPRDQRPVVTLGKHCIIRGWLESDSGHWENALDWYTRAVKTLEALYAKLQDVPDFRMHLGAAHGGRAQALNHLGRYAEAVPEWNWLLELEGPGVMEHQLMRLEALARVGDHARAIAGVQAMLAKPGPSGDLLRNAADIYSLSIPAAQKDPNLSATKQTERAKHYTNCAFELLKKAQAAGFFQKPANIQELHTDKDLEPIRSLPQFQEFLREIEGKKLNGEQRPPVK